MIDPSTLPPQTLLLDADDTLWENNVLFERAIASFISLLDHAEHTPAEVRSHLDRIEHQTIAERGYGTASFRISLRRCFCELAASPITPAQEQSLAQFADSISTAPIELLPGVSEALQRLAARHRLILVTKGDDLEQRQKLQLSGLTASFIGVEVLPEKTTSAYRDLIARHGLDPHTTWMIGNSPRSDINPALAAGLHAVFIPHPSTWVHEREALDPAPSGQRLLELPSLLHLADVLELKAIRSV